MDFMGGGYCGRVLCRFLYWHNGCGTHTKLKSLHNVLVSVVEKSFSSNYERINGTVVRDEKTNTETYTARCLCFASDATHKNIWVDTVELSGDTADAVRTTCDTDCQRLCEGRLADFTFAE